MEEGARKSKIAEAGAEWVSDAGAEGCLLLWCVGQCWVCLDRYTFNLSDASMFNPHKLWHLDRLFKVDRVLVQ